MHVHSLEYDLNLLQWNSVLALLSEFQMGCLCKTNDFLSHLRGKEFWVRKKKLLNRLPRFPLILFFNQRTNGRAAVRSVLYLFHAVFLAKKDGITSGWHLDGKFY